MNDVTTPTDASPTDATPLFSTPVALALTVVSGLLTGLSHPMVISALGPGPIDPSGMTGLLALVGVVPLLLATEGRSIGRAFGLAFVASWVHFIVLAHWLVVAFSHFGGLPFIAGSVSMLVVTAAVGFLPSTAVPAANLIEKELGLSRWWVFALTLAAAELLRDFMPFQGVPWGQAGVALGTVSVIAQSAAVIGVYGLVAFAGLMNGVVAHVVTAKLRGQTIAKPALIVAGSSLAIVLAYGALRLQSPPIPEGAPTIKMGLLQASIAQDTLNKSSKKISASIRAIYHDLQDEAVANGADVVVWPEAALRPGARGDINDLGRAGSIRSEVWHAGEQARIDNAPKAAIVGAVSTFISPDVASGKMKRSLYTSAFATGPGFSVVGRWDKVNLLPFGEYVPFPLSALIKAFVKVGGNLVLGETHRVVPMKIGDHDVKVGTTICYEGVFPGVTRKLANEGADVMVNITNDAWYGVSSEMPQHLVHYRLRAIESGRAVARAANSGISGWIDARGRVHGASKRDERVAVVVEVPLLNETPPVRWLGDWVAVLALILTMIGIWVSLFGRSLSSDRLQALAAPTRSLALSILPVVFAAMAISAWAPVDEGIRTLCDFSVGTFLFAGIAIWSGGKRIGWASVAGFGGLFVLGILAAISIQVTLAVFSLVGGIGAAVMVLHTRSRSS